MKESEGGRGSVMHLHLLHHTPQSFLCVKISKASLEVVILRWAHFRGSPFFEPFCRRSSGEHLHRHRLGSRWAVCRCGPRMGEACTASKLQHSSSMCITEVGGNKKQQSWHPAFASLLYTRKIGGAAEVLHAWFSYVDTSMARTDAPSPKSRDLWGQGHRWDELISALLLDFKRHFGLVARQEEWG